jgi:hypothetical protein
VLRGRAEEFAAVLPEIIGFPPTESVVVLCFGGAGRRPKELVFTVRLDLADAEHDRDLVEAVLQHVHRIQPPPQKVMFFVVTEAPDDEVTGIAADPWQVVLHRPGADLRPTVPDLPRRPLVHAFVEGFADIGTATQDAVLVRAGRWWSYPDVDPLTGAGAGTELDPVGSRLSGVAALNGRVVHPDRAAAAARAWPTAPPTIAQLGACQRAERDLVARLEDEDPQVVVADMQAAVEDALAAHQPGSRVALTRDALARVGAGLLLVPVRDHALTLSTTSRDDAGDLASAAAENLWTELVTRLPDDLAAVPALLLGYTAWLRGSGVLAVSALHRSLECEHSSMGEMLLQAIQANTPPDVLRAIMRDPGDVGAG